MAFEGVRQQTKRPRRNRLTLALSIGFHAALLGVGVAYSFWHIDELTPPSVKVTFLSAAPPPPPPPPPAGGGGAAKKKVVIKPKIVVPTKTPDIVQPRETPKEQPKETKVADNEAGGVKGGVKGGTIGGTVGGTIGGTVGGKIGGTLTGTTGGTGAAPKLAPKFLPQGLAAEQRISGPEPELPVFLRKPGANYVLPTKFCTNTAGTIETVTFLAHVDPALEQSLSSALKQWRMRPARSADGLPVPFCTIWKFEFRVN